VKDYYVYMMTNQSRHVLYTGVTNNLERRLHEHKQGEVPGFTSRYRVIKLVYFESCTDVRAAIAREKQIKGWIRKKKDALTETLNPQWQDLSAEWYTPKAVSEREILRATPSG
jgi:putative endonuclease